jgi:large subunit ribosomal protein L22
METQQKFKKSVRIRLAKEQKAEWLEENRGNQGDTRASLRNVPTAPRKMRLVADMIRGQRVSVALNTLRFDGKHASLSLEKLLLTAIADWQAKNEDVNIEEADLYVKEIFVDSGKMLKRLQTAPQGRAHRIRKRSNHVTMVIGDANAAEETVPTTETETESNG